MAAQTTAIRDPAQATQRALAHALDPERLAVVRRCGLLDAGVQTSLQRYALLASELTASPMSVVAILDDSRQYFSAAHGIQLSQTSLELSYSKHVVAEGARLSVSDTQQDPILADHPATAEFGVRAFLGSPVWASGVRVGALCVADLEPRAWDERAHRVIDGLSAAASADVQLRVLAAERLDAVRRDGLTGLGNRRALAEAIEQAVSDGRQVFVGMLDLDGFKSYNDTFGHPAGDALLIRLARRLETAISGRGQAFRMGGDEFCVLVDAKTTLLDAQEALSERGPAFFITSSLGSVELPLEACDATSAIGMVDRRLYGEKGSRPSSVHNQLTAALSAALNERDNDLGGHSDHVSTLAARVADALNMDSGEIRQVTLAARLHDIGKMAISERILNKTGPLDDQEWAQMRCHTLIGERILAAAPALGAAATLVRSSHERWDGKGYPDGLTGEEIPLGARIIFACDAYDAMRSDRPYREPVSQTEALEELRRCAGTQFDPRVIEALVAVTSAPSA